MTIPEAVSYISHLPNCEVYPPRGIPSEPLELPSDLRHFYELTGGAMLFRDCDYWIEIVRPDHFVRSNPVIAGVLGADDISFDWFIVASSSEQYITVDLGKDRLGRCYDSFWDRHAVRGTSQIIAVSFTSLLNSLIESKGSHWFWLRPEFPLLGDAYD